MEKRRGFIWKSFILFATACGQPTLENPHKKSELDDGDSGVSSRNKTVAPVDSDKPPTGSTKGDSGDSKGPINPNGSLKGVKIGIDVGHGITDKGTFDPGAMGNSIQENAENRKVAQALSQELRKRGAEVEIFDYKEGAPKRSLNEKGQAAAKGKDYMISCHHNAASVDAQYPIVLYGHTGSSDSKRLAEEVSKEFQKQLVDTKLIPKSVNSRAKAQSLGVMSGAKGHCKACVLLEPWFLTDRGMNQEIANKLTTPVAVAVATGVENFHEKTKNPVYSVLYSFQDLLAPAEWPYEPDPLYEGH